MINNEQCYNLGLLGILEILFNILLFTNKNIESQWHIGMSSGSGAGAPSLNPARDDFLNKKEKFVSSIGLARKRCYVISIILHI